MQMHLDDTFDRYEGRDEVATDRVQPSLSYSSFYEKYYNEVFYYLCRKCSSVEDARDLTQNIFMYCWQHFSEYDMTKASYRSWLYVIVISRWKNYCRQKKSSCNIEDFESCLSDEKNDIDRASDLEELRNEIAKQLLDLDTREREIIILHFFRGQTSKEIAFLLGITESNVRQIQRRALLKMKTGLEAIDF